MRTPIQIHVLAHEEQRYDTVGDWVFDADGQLDVSVSELGDWRYEALVGVHELVEALMCRHAGVTGAQVDAFDMEFERTRGASDAEPGDSRLAPYYRQHVLAGVIERLLAIELGVEWDEYESQIAAM